MKIDKESIMLFIVFAFIFAVFRNISLEWWQMLIDAIVLVLLVDWFRKSTRGR